MVTQGTLLKFKAKVYLKVKPGGSNQWVHFPHLLLLISTNNEGFRKHPSAEARVRLYYAVIIVAWWYFLAFLLLKRDIDNGRNLKRMESSTWQKECEVSKKVLALCSSLGRTKLWKGAAKINEENPVSTVAHRRSKVVLQTFKCPRV